MRAAERPQVWVATATPFATSRPRGGPKIPNNDLPSTLTMLSPQGHVAPGEFAMRNHFRLSVTCLAGAGAAQPGLAQKVNLLQKRLRTAMQRRAACEGCQLT